MERMTDEDIALSKALMPDLPLTIIAEKMEVSLAVLAQNALTTDFPISERLFNLRYSKGKLRLTGEDVEKWCKRCDDFHPLTEEFWYRSKNQPDGTHNICRACENTRKAKMRAEKRQAITCHLTGGQ